MACPLNLPVPGSREKGGGWFKKLQVLGTKRAWKATNSPRKVFSNHGEVLDNHGEVLIDHREVLDRSRKVPLLRWIKTRRRRFVRLFQRIQKRIGDRRSFLTWTKTNMPRIARKTPYYLYVKVGARSPRPLKFFR